MSDTLTPEHTSWLDGFLGGGGSDPAPQATAPSQPSPAGGDLSYSGPDGFGFTISAGDEAPAAPPPAAAQSNDFKPSDPGAGDPGTIPYGPSAFGTDETGREVPPDEAFGGTPATPTATAPAAPAQDEPSFWDKALAASITDPVLGVPRLIGGEFNDWMAERDRKQAAEEKEKAEYEEHREAQRQLDAQHNTKEKADEDVRRREAAEEDAANKRWEKIMKAEREKEAEAAAQAEYQKDKASRDPATQEYMTRQEKKHQQPTP